MNRRPVVLAFLAGFASTWVVAAVSVSRQMRRERRHMRQLHRQLYTSYGESEHR